MAPRYFQDATHSKGNRSTGHVFDEGPVQVQACLLLSFALITVTLGIGSTCIPGAFLVLCSSCTVGTW